MLKKWRLFIVERFDPASHLLMILVFVAAHWVMLRQRGAVPSSIDLPAVLALFAGTTVFFFKLRVYDEIKDYELDRVINPTRPLARGLLTHRDLYRAIVVCIALELALFASQGLSAFVAMLLPVAYSLLMYREFFIRDLIRPHLTTYAVSHTVVSGMLSLALLAALSGHSLAELGRAGYLFALNSWCLFNIFEFGRKTFTASEERAGVESYSKIFGRYGAVLLVLSQSAVSAYCLLSLHAAHIQLITLLGISNALLLGTGLAYAALNRPPYGKLYRAFSSVYIVLIYLGFFLIELI
jgi:4-hydroxybenzoate polyprenyltransferase